MQKNKPTGFTLVELLLVITIMGVLTTVSYINLGEFKYKARDARRIAEIKQIRQALEAYYYMNDSYPYFNDTSYADNPNGHWSKEELTNTWGRSTD